MENRHNFDLKNDVKSLITKIKYIQITEALKKPSEMDSDLVMECADFVLELENREVDLSPAEIKRRVEKIPFKNYNTQRSFKRRKLIKSIIIAAIILVVLVVTCMAVKPIRNFFTKVTDDGTFFSFSITDNNDYLYANYSFIPEGYVLVAQNNLKQKQQFEYDYHDSKLYILSTNNKESLQFINSEQSLKTGEILIGTNVAYYCINEEQTYLVWSTGKYNHVISADNCKDITIETLVKIALSRKETQ